MSASYRAVTDNYTQRLLTLIKLASIIKHNETKQNNVITSLVHTVRKINLILKSYVALFF
jgi:hypothetical protein